MVSDDDGVAELMEGMTSCRLSSARMERPVSTLSIRASMVILFFATPQTSTLSSFSSSQR